MLGFRWELTTSDVHRLRWKRPDGRGNCRCARTSESHELLSPPNAFANRSGRNNYDVNLGRWCDHSWHNGPPDSSSPGNRSGTDTLAKRLTAKLPQTPLLSNPPVNRTVTTALSIPDCRKFAATTTLRPCRQGWSDSPLPVLSSSVPPACRGPSQTRARTQDRHRPLQPHQDRLSQRRASRNLRQVTLLRSDCLQYLMSLEQSPYE